jgi:6-phospho-beta-glucosidase
MTLKVAVVGGGSTYTPELADGVARLADLLAVDELMLIDPATDRLATVGGFCARLFAHYGHPGRVRWTSDLDEGLDGSDVVLIQLRVGGQTARISDESFPLEFGCVGQETTGAGGLAKALRTVPVVLDVAERVARRAPGAWIIDFTNPVGIVTRALLDAGHRAVGLCNVAIGLQRRIAGLLGTQPSEVELGHVGLNHLTWELSATVNGVDRLPEFLAHHGEQLAGDVGLPPSMLQGSGTIPSYYLRYFYAHDAVVAEQQMAPTRGEEVARIEAELLRTYADPTVHTKPEALGKRGGAYYSEAAVGLMAGLLGHTPGAHAANVRNAGTLPFLSDNAVIEVTCDVDKTGVRPRPVADLAPELRGLIGHVSAYEDLAVDAALRGGADRVYRALLAHPLVGQHDTATAMTDRLIAANTAHLAWAR